MVILPPNIPPGRELDYQAAAEKVARGVSGALPAGSDVKFPGQGVRGESPYEAFCGAQEKDVVLAGTAGHLTMLALPTGIGKGASEEQDAARGKKSPSPRRCASMRPCSAILTRRNWRRNFRASQCVFILRLGSRTARTWATLLDNVVKAEGVGLQVDAAEISERSGLKLKAGGGASTSATGRGGARRSRIPKIPPPDRPRKRTSAWTKRKSGAAARNPDADPSNPSTL